jgi:hypothetical protein
MSRRLAVAALLWLAAAAAPAQTLDEIVAKNALARGGAAAWKAVESMSLAGRMELGQGMAVPFRLELKRPRSMRLEFDFAGKTAVQTFDGTVGWKLSPHLGREDAEPLSPAELASAAGQAELDGPLIDYAAKGHQLLLEGKEAVEGRDSYRLRLTLRNGETRSLFVDADSGLELLLETPYRLRNEDKPVRTHYRDYRSVSGLMIPHVLESRVLGSPRSHKLQIDSVRLNLPLAAARFGRPSPPTAAAPTAASAQRRSATR